MIELIRRIMYTDPDDLLYVEMLESEKRAIRNMQRRQIASLMWFLAVVSTSFLLIWGIYTVFPGSARAETECLFDQDCGPAYEWECVPTDDMNGMCVKKSFFTEDDEDSDNGIDDSDSDSDSDSDLYY